MTPIISKWAFLLALVSFVLFTGGCTMTHTIHAEPSLENLPKIEKVQAKAGIYYSPELKEYEHSRIFGPHKYVVPIGSDSVANFDKVLPMVFEKVELVNSLPPYPKDVHNVDFVLEPFIDHFNFRLGLENLSDDFNIKYRFSLYSRDGSLIKTWRIVGQPDDSKRSTVMAYNHIDADMEDALRKFISGFNVGTPLRTEIVEKLTGSETDTLQSIASDKVKISVKPSRETIQIGEEKALLLNDYGIVILDVVIDNQSESAIKVDNSAFRLVLFNGKQISPSGVSAIFPHLEKRSYSGDITSVFLGPIIAVAVTSNEEAIKRERRQSFENQLESKSLHNVNLEPGQSTHGLIFFIPSTDTANFNEAQLLAWFKDQENRSFRQDYLLNDVAYSNSTQNENK